MAYIAINSTFQPYSFEEILKPYQMYGEEYRRQEAAIDAAREKAFTESLRSGSQAEALYNNAQNELRSVSDELATKGMTSGLNSRIRSVSRDYRDTMAKLNNAQAKYDAEMQRRLKLGEDYVFQDNDIDIDTYLSGNTPSSNQISLSNTTKDIAAKTSALAQSIVQDPVWSKIAATNGQYWNVRQTSGLTAAQMDYILSKDDKGRYLWQVDPSLTNQERQMFKQFTDIVDETKVAQGYDNYSVNDQLKLENAYRGGLYGALGKTVNSIQQDRGYVNWVTAASAARAQQEHDFKYKIENGKIVGYNPDYVAATSSSKSGSKSSGGNGGSGSSSETLMQQDESTFQVNFNKVKKLKEKNSSIADYDSLAPVYTKPSTSNYQNSTRGIIIRDMDQLVEKSGISEEIWERWGIKEDDFLNHEFYLNKNNNTFTRVPLKAQNSVKLEDSSFDEKNPLQK